MVRWLAFALRMRYYGWVMLISKIYQEWGLHIQQLDYSCGPVSLLNVLALKGDKSRSETELAKLCKAEPNRGTDTIDLVAAARDIGLEVVEVKQDADISDLESHLNAAVYPIVCYRSLGGGGHYSIVTEYDDKALYLFDCSYGLIRIEKDTFYKVWRNKHEPLKRWFMAIK